MPDDKITMDMAELAHLSMDTSRHIRTIVAEYNDTESDKDLSEMTYIISNLLISHGLVLPNPQWRKIDFDDKTSFPPYDTEVLVANKFGEYKAKLYKNKKDVIGWKFLSRYSGWIRVKIDHFGDNVFWKRIVR